MNNTCKRDLGLGLAFHSFFRLHAHRMRTTVTEDEALIGNYLRFFLSTSLLSCSGGAKTCTANSDNCLAAAFHASTHSILRSSES
jgi:hypothetical protein